MPQIRAFQKIQVRRALNQKLLKMRKWVFRILVPNISVLAFDNVLVFLAVAIICPVLSVRPGSRRSSGGYSCESPAVFLHFPLEEKGAPRPLLSALTGASKRETPTSNLTESTACHCDKTEWGSIQRTISKGQLTLRAFTCIREQDLSELYNT